MPPVSRRRRLAGAVLLAVAGAPFVLGLHAARAQEVAPTGADQFGGFTLLARANGVLATYDSPGTFPFSPVIQFSIPEAMTTLTTGPSGYALASLALPGPLLGNLPAVIEQSGNTPPPGVGPYPIRAEANSPSGDADATQDQGPVHEQAHAEGDETSAKTTYTGLAAAPAIDAGSVTSLSKSLIEGNQVVSGHTTMSDVSAIAGVVHVDSVTTDLVANSTGTTANSEGVTRVNGLTVLGLRAEVSADGFHFVEDPPAPGSPFPGPLASAVNGLTSATSPINQLLGAISGPRDQALEQLVKQAGITIRIGKPITQRSGGFASRTVDGLIIESKYNGETTPVLSALLAAVPSSQLPDQSPSQVPINASPQALVDLLRKTHIESVRLAPGSVNVNASPAFVTPDIPIDVPPAADIPAAASSAPSGFDTPLPALPAATGTGATPSTGSDGGGGFTSTPVLVAGTALPALAGVFLLFGLPFFAVGSTRLADNSLAAVTRSCPDGLDQPLPEQP